MGELAVPADALWGAQTQRALQNFRFSDLRMPREFLRALALIKSTAAQVNGEFGLLDPVTAAAIASAGRAVAAGQHDADFPLDVFQTGSGTSTNMNANEVLARLASAATGRAVHPNDHVNLGQSSNDVIPTAIHVSACLCVSEKLLPSLRHLQATLAQKIAEVGSIVKTGRTHLMDAMPITFGQELSGWAQQIESGIARLDDALKRMRQLPIGGTAVGTGINADARFGPTVAARLSQETGFQFVTSKNFFEGLSSQDAAVELSGQLNTLACSLMKISNDLRWMNSGPLAGLGEIELKSLQPGSSIMPGKVNPVIPEAVCMIAAQVIGNHSAITVAGQSGNFQLNVMLPVVAHNLLQSIGLLANAAVALADSAIRDFVVKREHINASLERNPMLVTALNSVIGYELGAQAAKRAYAEGRPIREVVLEMTDLDEAQVDALLDPLTLTKGGTHAAGSG